MQDQVLGPYRILDLVGRGGTGEVYRAEDTRLGRVVALKLLPLGLADDPLCRERLLREARAASRLNHPSIATIYEVDEIDGQVFISMEYVRGASLARRLEGGRLPLGEIVSIGSQIADALTVAHREGVIHRDIKPANILVSDDGQVKVVDFGIALEQAVARGGSERVATQPTRLTASGSIVGTIAYMSPEQARGATPDARSDLFSFGVVLYEMATGTSPFRGHTPLALAASILHDPPAPLDGSLGDLPSGLRTILFCCLDKRPERRPASAVQIKEALEHLERGSTTGSIRRILGRNPWPRRALVAAGIVGLVAVSILLGYRLSRVRSTEPARIHGVEAQRLYKSAQQYELRGSTLANFTLAEQMYRRAYELDPGNRFLEGELARFLAFFEMEYLGGREGRVEEIRKLSDDVLAHDPQVAPAWIARAALLLLDGDTAGAEAAAKRAIELDAKEPGGHLLLGASEIKRGEVERGLDRLRKVIETSERGHLAGRAMLARALYDLGQMDEAAAEYRKLLRYAPDSPTALNNLAAICLGRGNYVEAVGLLEQILAIQPDDFAAANLGSAYFYLGRMDEAIAAYRKAVDLAPNQPTLKQNLAEAYEESGKAEEASRWFEKAIDAYDVSLPRIVEGAQAGELGERAFCEAKLGRFSEAYRDLDRALTLEPSDMNILRSAARVHATAGNRGKAYAFVRRAVAAGYHREEIRNDPAFRKYEDDPEFLRLLTDPAAL